MEILQIHPFGDEFIHFYKSGLEIQATGKG